MIMVLLLCIWARCHVIITNRDTYGATVNVISDTCVPTTVSKCVML